MPKTFAVLARNVDGRKTLPISIESTGVGVPITFKTGQFDGDDISLGIVVAVSLLRGGLEVWIERAEGSELTLEQAVTFLSNHLHSYQLAGELLATCRTTQTAIEIKLSKT